MIFKLRKKLNFTWKFIERWKISYIDSCSFSAKKYDISHFSVNIPMGKPQNEVPTFFDINQFLWKFTEQWKLSYINMLYSKLNNSIL